MCLPTTTTTTTTKTTTIITTTTIFASSTCQRRSAEYSSIAAALNKHPNSHNKNRLSGTLSLSHCSKLRISGESLCIHQRPFSSNVLPDSHVKVQQEPGISYSPQSHTQQKLAITKAIIVSLLKAQNQRGKRFEVISDLCHPATATARTEWANLCINCFTSSYSHPPRYIRVGKINWPGCLTVEASLGHSVLWFRLVLSLEYDQYVCCWLCPGVLSSIACVVVFVVMFGFVIVSLFAVCHRHCHWVCCQMLCLVGAAGSDNWPDTDGTTGLGYCWMRSASLWCGMVRSLCVVSLLSLC